MKRLIAAMLFAAMPVAAQAPQPDVRALLNCGTLSGEGTVILRIDGKTLAILQIACGGRT